MPSINTSFRTLNRMFDFFCQIIFNEFINSRKTIKQNIVFYIKHYNGIGVFFLLNFRFLFIPTVPLSWQTNCDPRDTNIFYVLYMHRIVETHKPAYKPTIKCSFTHTQMLLSVYRILRVRRA